MECCLFTEQRMNIWIKALSNSFNIHVEHDFSFSLYPFVLKLAAFVLKCDIKDVTISITPLITNSYYAVNLLFYGVSKLIKEFPNVFKNKALFVVSSCLPWNDIYITCFSSNDTLNLEYPWTTKCTGISLVVLRKSMNFLRNWILPWLTIFLK